MGEILECAVGNIENPEVVAHDIMTKMKSLDPTYENRAVHEILYEAYTTREHLEDKIRSLTPSDTRELDVTRKKLKKLSKTIQTFQKKLKQSMNKNKLKQSIYEELISDLEWYGPYFKRENEMYYGHEQTNKKIREIRKIAEANGTCYDNNIDALETDSIQYDDSPSILKKLEQEQMENEKIVDKALKDLKTKLKISSEGRRRLTKRSNEILVI